jgi:hypothetical protein
MNLPGWSWHPLKSDLRMQAAYDLWRARKKRHPKIERLAA